MSLRTPSGTAPAPQEIAALADAARTRPREVFLAQAARFAAVWQHNFGAQSALGALYASLGLFDQAEGAFRTALALNAADAEAQFMLGVTLHELGRHEEACSLLAALPGNPDAETYLGLALEGLGQFEAACAAFETALSRDPRNPRALNNLGACRMALRRYEDAAAVLQQALGLEPDYLDAALNLADVWIAQGDIARSRALIEHFLQRSPRNPDLHAKLADVLVRGGTPAQAIAVYERALSLAPTQADIHASLGKAWHELGDLTRAAAHLTRAIALDPDNARFLTDYGIVLEEAGKRREAIAAFEQASTLDPQDDFIAARLYGTRMQVCDWTGLGETTSRLVALGTGESPVSPFAMITAETDPARQLQRTRCYARKYAAIRPAPLAVPPAPDGRIRIGYFSADFHQHATMLLLAGVLREHDRKRFSVTAYSFGPDADDPVRKALLGDVERFVDVRGMDSAAVVALARGHGLDIAVDLKGYTRHNRAELFAYRLAPVQVNWLGFPGTCGTGFHDYLLGDSMLTPPEAQLHYSEQLIRMPFSYQCNDDRRPIADWSPTRRELGLPDDGFVFCCFNNLYKITPQIFAIWLRLLGAVPGSVLWLLRSNAEAEANLRAAAQAAGLDPARLIFAAPEPNPRHLARMTQADLFLDTFPCNAHTTASDALWAGLPLLTLMGETFPARVAASLLHACGLPELVTTAPEDYEALALALAQGPTRLAALRARLADGRAAAPLFDTRQFTRDLETAFAMAVQHARAGLRPKGFAVPNGAPIAAG